MKSTRSPSYPYIDLKDAISKAKEMYAYASRHTASIEGIYKHWGFTGPTGSSKKTLAALKNFGLIEQIHGSKDAKLSSRALLIIHGLEGSPEKKDALKQAFLSPDIYKYCWDLWGTDALTMDESAMSSHLILHKKFNDSAVSGFITNYKQSLKHSGIAKSVGEESIKDEPELPKVGDYIQWESQGVLQFTEPKRVIKVMEDGYLYVDGSLTAIPIDQTEIVEPPLRDPELQRGKTPSPPPIGHNMKQDVFTLEEGQVIIQWPVGMSEGSFEDFTDWLCLQHRKIGRSATGDNKPTLSKNQSHSNEHKGERGD